MIINNVNEVDVKINESHIICLMGLQLLSVLSYSPFDHLQHYHHRCHQS